MSVSPNWNNIEPTQLQVLRTAMTSLLQHPTASSTVSSPRDSLALITVPAGPLFSIVLCRRVFPLSAPPRTPYLTEAGPTCRTSFFEWRDRGYRMCSWARISRPTICVWCRRPCCTQDLRTQVSPTDQLPSRSILSRAIASRGPAPTRPLTTGGLICVGQRARHITSAPDRTKLPSRSQSLCVD
jgi:hypothetical protein